jgi:hypothetical protein
MVAALLMCRVKTDPAGALQSYVTGSAFGGGGTT